MTMQRIVELLNLLILELANEVPTPSEDIEAHEWAYVKGLAAGAIRQAYLRD